MPANLETMTERELYNLAWNINEELVEREMARNVAKAIVGRYEIARPTPKKCATSYTFDSADDNYGCW